MESPFENNKTIAFYVEPILNPYNKAYQNIITLSTMPDGPLENMVSMQSFPKLSPFHQNNQTMRDQCVYALLRYPKSTRQWKGNDREYFMNGEDVPSLFSYLSSNGYTIESDLTRLMFDSNIKNTSMESHRHRKLICYATFRS